MNHKPASFRIHPTAHAARALVMLAGLAGPGLALAQLEFSKSPPRNIAGSVSTSTSVSGGVLPNVIVAVDGTGSMSAADAACQTGSVKDAFGTNYPLTCPAKGIKSRMEALSDALLMAFSDPALVGKIRLAFQATSLDAGFGPNRFNRSSHDNSMKVFTKEYQADFMNWAFLLKSRIINCNPTEPMIAYAGEYLKGQWIASGASNYVCENGGNLLPGTNSPDPKYYLKFTSIPAADNPWNSNAKLRTKLAAKDASDAIAETNSDRLSCRRSYLIFMTDGGVNGNQFAPVGTTGNNYGGSAHPLPDGTTYDPTQYYGKVYSDFSPNNYADHTLYYWGTDLTGKGKGVLTPTTPVTSAETFTYKSYSQTYQPYWNPKNDPATWQHMQTYTIGFGASGGAGNLPSGKYANPSGSSSTRIDLPIGFDGYDAAGNVLDYGNFFQMFATGAPMNGAISWPYVPDCDGCKSYSSGLDVTLDVYHAALAGRGKYYPATSVNALSAAFRDILNTAIDTTDTPTTTDTATSTSGMASAAGSSTQLIGGMAYAASYAYDPDKADNGLGGWSGSLKSYSGSNPGGDVLWPASFPSSRSVFTSNPSGTGGAALPDSVRTGVNKLGQTLGDIVNSQLVYVGKPTLLSLNAGYLKFASKISTDRANANHGMVYVGANDGMLHAFDAGQGKPGAATQGTGAEQFAYVPLGLQSRVSAIGSDTEHHWGVDGGIFSGDAQLDRQAYTSIDYADIPANSKNWATVLVGTLSAGGKGYFVLDVTDPIAIKNAIEGSDPTTLDKAVLADKTAPNEAEAATIGYQFGQPVMDPYNLTLQSAQIMQINTKDANNLTEWAVIMGNGYNSKNGVPVLLIQSLSKAGRPLYAVPATCTATTPECQAAGNGLGQPRAVDVDGNGTADIVYAGDLMGNLWKFDISDPDNTKWKVAYNQKPMFQAVGPTGAAQPITSAPVVVPNKNGGFMVGFGTGKNLTDDDTKDAPTSTGAPLNSFYVLYDKQKMSVSTEKVGSQNVSKLTLEGSASPICSGGTRYAGCLYQRTSGKLSAVSSSTLNAGATDVPILDASKDDAEKIDGISKFGWYYDIPEAGSDNNGNAAKVLSNPMMLSDNTVLFLADNVASSTTSGSGGSGGSSKSPAQTSGEETCETTTTTTTTTTEESTVNNALTSINYFNLMNGSPPDNITITVNGVTHTFDNNPDHTDGKRGNRFSVPGWTKFVRSGTDGLARAGGGGECNDKTKCDEIKHEPITRAGRRVGWRLGGH